MTHISKTSGAMRDIWCNEKVKQQVAQGIHPFAAVDLILVTVVWWFPKFKNILLFYPHL
jgi:hypothetical protein